MPSIKPLLHQVMEEKLLPEAEHTRIRALAVRANYLAADPVDVTFVAREISRFLAKPTPTWR